jgi:hypothetical protein
MTAHWWSGEMQDLEEAAVRANVAAAEVEGLFEELAAVLERALPDQVEVERERRGRGAVRSLEVEVGEELFTCRRPAGSSALETTVATRHGDVAGRGRRLAPAAWVSQLREGLRTQTATLETFSEALRGLLS